MSAFRDDTFNVFEKGHSADFSDLKFQIILSGTELQDPHWLAFVEIPPPSVGSFAIVLWKETYCICFLA